MNTKPLVLRQYTTELGLSLSDYQLNLFNVYLQQLTYWNTHFNLTSVTDTDEIQTKHFLDSLTLVLSNISFKEQNMIDIGSGAGFPGLALKIAIPSIHMSLLEATGKKSNFLKQLIKLLDMDNTIVINKRAEATAHEYNHRESYDIAVSRAVAPLNTLCELCLPFCRVGGTFIAMKKGELNDELSLSQTAIDILGGKLTAVVPLKVDILNDDRKLIIINKIKPTPDIYPRRPGIPAKKPIV